LHSFPTRRSSDLDARSISSVTISGVFETTSSLFFTVNTPTCSPLCKGSSIRSEEHTSELQSRFDLVCRLLLEKKKHNIRHTAHAYCSGRAQRHTTHRDCE